MPITASTTLELDPIALAQLIIQRVSSLFNDEHGCQYAEVSTYVIDTKRLLKMWVDGHLNCVGSKEKAVQKVLDDTCKAMYPHKHRTEVLKEVCDFLDEIKKFRLPTNWNIVSKYKKTSGFFMQVSDELTLLI